MGCLHDGHLSLVKHAQRTTTHTVVSIFVNPSQFAPHEDFNKYPRTLETDIEKLSSLPTPPDVVFAPNVNELYPSGITLDVSKQRGSFVEVLGLSHQMEGSIRPHFFRGVATVVTKLFNIVQPDVAVFGQKDVQQCCVIQAMVRDLHFPIRIEIAETMREKDGLAMSSRNRYLDLEVERPGANTLYLALIAAQKVYNESAKPVPRDLIIDTASKVIRANTSVEYEYLSLASPKDLSEVDVVDPNCGGAILSGAIRVGKTRLIDNVLLDVTLSK